MKQIYQGKIFSIYHDVRTDEFGIEHTIERCMRGDVVTVIGITDRNEIALIREYRPGIGKYVYGLPGGKVGKNENPMDCASREFCEETGYASDKLGLIHKKCPSDFFIGDGYVYLADSISPVPSSLRVTGDEKGPITIKLVTIEEALSLIREGHIPNEFFCFLLYKLFDGGFRDA